MNVESILSHYLSNSLAYSLSVLQHQQSITRNTDSSSSSSENLVVNGVVAAVAQDGQEQEQEEEEFSPESKEDHTVDDCSKRFTDSIADLCQCTCQLCNKKMTSKSLKEHIRKMHKMSREEYIDKFGAIGYTNLTYHKCKLCKRTLKAAVIVITNHLKKTHGLTFQEYRLRFGVFEGEQTKTKLFIKNRKTRIESKPESPQEEQNVNARSENEDFLAKKSEFLRRFYFSHFLNNFQHLHSTMKRLGEIDEPGKHKILCEEKSISSPLILPDHESKIHEEKFPLPPGKSTKENGISDAQMEGDDGSDHNEVEDEYKDAIFTDDINNFCKSECKLCGKTMTLKSLRAHLRLRHSGNIKEYRRLFGGVSYTTLTHHRCKICGKVMKAALITISNHLKHQHGMPFNQYREKFNVFNQEIRRTRPPPAVGVL